MVQVLIGQGADLNVADKVAEKLNPKNLKNMICKIQALELQEGWTALHCAAHAGYLDVAKLLVESGASAEVVPLDLTIRTLLIVHLQTKTNLKTR